MTNNKLKKSFTLLEITITVALIVLVGTAIMILLNPNQQINKARDSKRKSELSTLKKTFEDYYNDKNCYPKLSEVCYNARSDSEYAPDEAKVCNICGSNPLSPSFPYLSTLPCDPESPKNEFLYQVDDLTCPKWFRIYSDLGYSKDPAIGELGCFGDACGPRPNYGYDYGVTSPNTEVENADAFYCFNNNGNCNSCGASYEACYTRLTCQKYKKFYSSPSSCCQDNNICPTMYYCTYIVNQSCIECGYSASECSATGKCQMDPVSTITRGSCP